MFRSNLVHSRSPSVESTGSVVELTLVWGLALPLNNVIVLYKELRG